MAANRRDYYREYKRRQRAARRAARACIDCGQPAPEHTRCSTCRDKELARLRRGGHLMDPTDPASVRKFLRRAKERLAQPSGLTPEAWKRLAWNDRLHYTVSAAMLRREVQRLTALLENLKAARPRVAPPKPAKRSR